MLVLCTSVQSFAQPHSHYSLNTVFLAESCGLSALAVWNLCKNKLQLVLLRVEHVPEKERHTYVTRNAALHVLQPDSHARARPRPRIHDFRDVWWVSNGSQPSRKSQTADRRTRPSYSRLTPDYDQNSGTHERIYVWNGMQLCPYSSPCVGENREISANALFR